jgi:hypothetical protein
MPQAAQAPPLAEQPPAVNVQPDVADGRVWSYKATSKGASIARGTTRTSESSTGRQRGGTGTHTEITARPRPQGKASNQNEPKVSEGRPWHITTVRVSPYSIYP